MIRNVHAPSRRDRKKAFKSRAWLNGSEVTQHCYYADDKHGFVRLFQYDADGHHFIDHRGDIAKVQKHGKVVLGRSE